MSASAGLRRIARQVLDRLPSPARAWLEARYYARLLRLMDSAAEPDLIVVAALVCEGQTVVDIGANIGVYTHTLSRLVGIDGRVVSIEPIAPTFSVLQRVAGLLRWDNVSLVPAAISDRAGILWMRIPKDDRGIPNHYLARVVDRTGDAREVSAVTMDSLVRDMAVAFVKIDVEGHELSCLRGGLETLRRSQPALLVEIDREGWGEGATGSAVAGLLCAEGYGMWVFDGTRLRMCAGSRQYVNFWFLTPGHVDLLRARAPTLIEGPTLSKPD